MSSDKREEKKKNIVGKRLLLGVLIVLAVLAITGTAVYRSLVVKPQLPSHSEPNEDRPPVLTSDPEAEQTQTPEEPLNNERKSKDFLFEDLLDRCERENGENFVNVVEK
jgi:hypothetical protein